VVGPRPLGHPGWMGGADAPYPPLGATSCPYLTSTGCAYLRQYLGIWNGLLAWEWESFGEGLVRGAAGASQGPKAGLTQRPEGLPEGSNPSGQVARRRGPYQAARAGERPGRRRCGLRVGHRPRPGGQGRVRGGWSWRVSVCNFGCEPCSGHRRLTCAIGSHWDVRECLIFGRKKDCTILASFLHYARVKLVHVTTPLGGIAHDHNTICEWLCKGDFSPRPMYA